MPELHPFTGIDKATEWIKKGESRRRSIDFERIYRKLVFFSRCTFSSLLNYLASLSIHSFLLYIGKHSHIQTLLTDKKHTFRNRTHELAPVCSHVSVEIRRVDAFVAGKLDLLEPLTNNAFS